MQWLVLLLLGLAAQKVQAQTEQWAVWTSPITSAGSASGTLDTKTFTITVNPVGDGTNGGLTFTSIGSSTLWSNTTNYGPNAPVSAKYVHAFVRACACLKG